MYVIDIDGVCGAASSSSSSVLLFTPTDTIGTIRDGAPGVPHLLPSS